MRGFYAWTGTLSLVAALCLLRGVGFSLRLLPDSKGESDQRLVRQSGRGDPKFYPYGAPEEWPEFRYHRRQHYIQLV